MFFCFFNIPLCGILPVGETPEQFHGLEDVAWVWLYSVDNYLLSSYNVREGVVFNFKIRLDFVQRNVLKTLLLEMK